MYSTDPLVASIALNNSPPTSKADKHQEHVSRLEILFVVLHLPPFRCGATVIAHPD